MEVVIDKELDKKLRNIFGVSVKDVEKLCDNTYKLMWEQFLLLCLYARQQYIDRDNESYFDYKVEDSKNFDNKIKLIDLMETKKIGENIYMPILQMIEKYKSSNDIIVFLNENSNNQQCTELLELISKRHISFYGKNPNQDKHQYSYFSMYLSLYESIDKFINLIKLRYSSDYILDLYLRLIKKSTVGLCRTSILGRKLQKVENIENFLELIEGENSFDKEQVMKKLYLELSNILGNNMKEFFSELLIYKGNLKESIFDLIVYVDKNTEKNNGEYIIKIKKDAFKSMEGLGRAKDIFIYIQNQFIDSRSSSVESENTTCILINKWYEESKTELCPSIFDCPKLVASIIEFDIRKCIGLFSLEGEHYIFRKPNILLNKEIYIFVTAIIQGFLFRKGDFNSIIKSKSDFEYSREVFSEKRGKKDLDFYEFLKEKILNNFDTEIYENNMMEVWSKFNFENDTLDENSDDYKAVINRFKKLPIYLKVPKVPKVPEVSEVSEVSEEEEEQKILTRKNPEKIHKRKKSGEWNIRILIERQKNSNSTVSYPITSNYPLPLWTKVDSMLILDPRQNNGHEVPLKLT
jgi:hypothetical protein